MVSYRLTTYRSVLLVNYAVFPLLFFLPFVQPILVRHVVLTMMWAVLMVMMVRAFVVMRFMRVRHGAACLYAQALILYHMWWEFVSRVVCPVATTRGHNAPFYQHAWLNWRVEFLATDQASVWVLVRKCHNRVNCGKVLNALSRNLNVCRHVIWACWENIECFTQNWSMKNCCLPTCIIILS